MTLLPFLIKELNETRTFGPFRIRFRLRNPRIGDGIGRGVGSEELISTYGRSLESLWRHFSTPPHLRPLPKPLIDVYVLDVFDTLQGVPFMAVTKGVPYIVLPCRIPEPTTVAETLYATVCALHEGSHVLCEAQRGYARPESMRWRWFNEATAVWSEMLLSPDNPSTMGYFLGWCDFPERSLTVEPYWYGAGLFARYLEHELSEEFVSRVWTDGDRDRTPLETIERLGRSRGRQDLFHAYSVDSYFKCTHTGKDTVFANALRRFGGRAISHSYDLKPGQNLAVSPSLEPVSTQYYRIYPVSGATAFTINQRNPNPEVHASLALSSGDCQRVDPGPSIGTQSLALHSPCDHVLLVVSNTSAIEKRATALNVRAD